MIRIELNIVHYDVVVCDVCVYVCCVCSFSVCIRLTCPIFIDFVLNKSSFFVLAHKYFIVLFVIK